VSAGPTLVTERLTLRRWRDADRAAFHALNSDPAVMATIGPIMRRSESDAFMNRIELHFEQHGYGLWCVDLGGDAIGFTGLSHPWFREGVEIGWRIRSDHWGRGYAPEAAQAVLAFGLEQAGLDEIVSFTATTNLRSRRVMEKIGLRRDPVGDFDHPSLPDGDPLRPHVLYRLPRPTDPQV
jgi:ribosomal-protein-alanine N-acetyltransferase